MRLIDADALVGEIKDFWHFSDLWIKAEVVRNAPTIDAVPVVRCKDCKWYEIAHLKRDGTEDKRYTPSVCVRGTYAKLRKADWYCADGERREDG